MHGNGGGGFYAARDIAPQPPPRPQTSRAVPTAGLGRRYSPRSGRGRARDTISADLPKLSAVSADMLANDRHPEGGQPAHGLFKEPDLFLRTRIRQPHGVDQSIAPVDCRRVPVAPARDGSAGLCRDGAGACAGRRAPEARARCPRYQRPARGDSKSRIPAIRQERSTDPEANAHIPAHRFTYPAAAHQGVQELA